VQQSSGLSLKWLIEGLKLYEDLQLDNPEVDKFDLLIKQVHQTSPGAGGLIFLPYLAGERTPHLDPHARGVIFGIDLNHHRGHLVRAVLEGIAFSQCDAINLLRKLSAQIDYMIVSGGVAQNVTWHQLIADITGLDVYHDERGNGAAFGAALLALVGIGRYSNISTACEKCVKLIQSAQPRPSVHEIYKRSYALYKEIYIQLEPLFKKYPDEGVSNGLVTQA
jgi:xylulokinase